MIGIGIIGYGTVGSGVFEVLRTNKKDITEKAGEELFIKKICDLRDFPNDEAEALITHNFDDLLEDKEISVIVETMGGTDPAFRFVKSALEAGKSVCSSNKELVAKHGASLIRTAKENGVNFFFEASVGGGIPIIRPFIEALTADRILEIRGIMNGTTNFILTKMSKEGADYETALKEAQEMGYAERNPEADVEGHDTCRKIAILTSLAYGKQVDFSEIYTEGITKITKEDMDYAKALNASIKLIGESRKVGESVFARVAPMMISAKHPLYSVKDVFNAIFVKGNVLDDAMFYGRGAGKLPTASAVMADVISAVRNRGRHIPVIWSEEKRTLEKTERMKQRFFVRTERTEREKALSIFERAEEVRTDKVKGEFAFITEVLTEEEFRHRMTKLKVIHSIRVDF